MVNLPGHSVVRAGKADLEEQMKNIPYCFSPKKRITDCNLQGKKFKNMSTGGKILAGSKNLS
jgi:hypothetical protein